VFLLSGYKTPLLALFLIAANLCCSQVHSFQPQVTRFLLPPELPRRRSRESASFCPQYYSKLEKALGERRYLRQSKAIRQVASQSSLCQRFPYAPFNAMVKNFKAIQNPGFLPDQAQN